MKKRLSTIFEPPDLFERGVPASDAEIEFFKANGFLFKRGMLEKVEACDAMSRIWRSLHQALSLRSGMNWTLSSDDPNSWRNPQWAEMPKADDSGFFEGRQRTAVHGRTVKLHEIGNEDYLLKLLPHNPKVRAVAKALLGEPLKPIERTRGVYAIFPTSELTDEERQAEITGDRLGPHTDRVCQQLNVCAYLEDVPPRSGGFTVYPGSHKILFKAHQYESNWSPTEHYNEAISEVVNNTTPVEFVGEQGDVVYWHGRMVHSSGIHVGSTIRWAVFADFMLDETILDANEHRALGQYEWFKDAKLLRTDREVGDDMWRSWKISSD